MQLQHFRRLLEARDSGRAIRIRTLSGRVLSGRVEAVAATAHAGDLEGEVVMETTEGEAECLDLALILTVVLAEPPIPRIPSTVSAPIVSGRRRDGNTV